MITLSISYSVNNKLVHVLTARKLVKLIINELAVAVHVHELN